MDTITFSSIALALIYTSLAWFSWRLYCHRLWINRLRIDGMPMPAWSWISGHLLYLYKHHRSLPPLANVNLAFVEMALAFKEDEMFLLDIWPLSEPMLVVFNADAAFQICQKLNLPKAKTNETMTRPITGGATLLSMNGDVWKTWRNLFNPGFSPGIMMEQVPQIVESVSSFCERLREHTNGGIVCLDHLTTRLTFEIILKVSLNADLGPHYDRHVFVRAMGNIIKWHSFWDPLVLMNPLRPFVNWYNGQIVDSWIQSELQQRYEALKQGLQSVEPTTKCRTKSVMDLAIEGYIESREDANPRSLDSGFLQTATHQMRLFLFAGNDTTSSTICFAYHLLSKSSEILAQLRSEHDSVFGTDLSTTADQLKENPSLLGKCKLTLAVLKETLRLYPPAATMRHGNPECFLTTQKGIPIPTNNFDVLFSHPVIHRNERLWLRADEFLPERWLVGPEHEFFPQPGAWRPFEFGPRGCIGQTLAMNEMKVVLIMTTRVFDIKPAYEDFDSLQSKNQGLFHWLLRSIGFGSKEPGMYYGDRAYQTEKAGAHPSEAYPCYVSAR